MMTVNEAIQFLNTLKGRVAQLRELRKEVSTRNITPWGGDKDKIVEPQYDVKKLDAHVVRLENTIWKLDAHIKSINAKTKIELEINTDDLLKPLE